VVPDILKVYSTIIFWGQEVPELLKVKALCCLEILGTTHPMTASHPRRPESSETHYYDYSNWQLNLLCRPEQNVCEAVAVLAVPFWYACAIFALLGFDLYFILKIITE
jgi:hypothetical protein